MIRLMNTMHHFAQSPVNDEKNEGSYRGSDEEDRKKLVQVRDWVAQERWPFRTQTHVSKLRKLILGCSNSMI